MTHKLFMDVDELAEMWGVPKSWIYSHVRGEDPIPRTYIGKYLRFQQDKVMDWLENQQKKSV